jgi:hypothetical protein
MSATIVFTFLAALTACAAARAPSAPGVPPAAIASPAPTAELPPDGRVAPAEPAASFLIVGQDPTPPSKDPAPPAQKPTPPPLKGDTPAPNAELEKLVPGQLPAATDAATRETWEKVLAATLGKAGERKPVTAFSLEIDVLYKARVATTNQGVGLYEYLAPGHVRLRFKDSKREVLRGPDGDWLVDPSRDEASRIERSRESQEDTRQLDDMVSIGRNFVALTDPKSLRLASLAKLATPPAGLFGEHAKRAKELVWLEFASPDFRLARSGRETKLHRVQLGLDPKTWLPTHALVHDDSSQAPLSPTSIFLVLGDWFQSNGYQVPKKIQLWEIDDASLATGRSDPRRLRFRLDPTSDVFLMGATINPPLKPEAFVPAKKG